MMVSYAEGYAKIGPRKRRRVQKPPAECQGAWVPGFWLDGRLSGSNREAVVPAVPKPGL